MIRLRSFAKALAGIDEPIPTLDPVPEPETPFESTAESMVDPAINPTMEAAADPAVAPVEAVLRAFGVRRERDLDALTAPPRVIGAMVQLLLCGALAVAVTAAHGPLVGLMLHLELESIAAVAPTAVASVVALLTLLAALRLGVRMRNAERRRLYLRFRSRWNGELDPARAHVSRRGKRPPDPDP